VKKYKILDARVLFQQANPHLMQATLQAAGIK
jgi:hypothetical protein